MQGFLQVDDDLAPVAERQRDHSACALAIDIGVRCVVDLIAALLHGEQQLLGTVHEFKVGHYNFDMLRASQILVSPIILAASMAGLSACGQRGPLYLPTEPASAQRATLPQTLTPIPSQAPSRSAAASSATP